MWFDVKMLLVTFIEKQAAFLALIGCWPGSLWWQSWLRKWSVAQMMLIMFVEDGTCFNKTQITFLLLTWFQFYSPLNVWFNLIDNALYGKRVFSIVTLSVKHPVEGNVLTNTSGLNDIWGIIAIFFTIWIFIVYVLTSFCLSSKFSFLLVCGLIGLKIW